MQSFTERMALAKTIAQHNRNRGLHTGKAAKGWNVRRPIANDQAAWVARWRNSWRQDCREILNDYRAAILNGHAFGKPDAIPL